MKLKYSRISTHGATDLQAPGGTAVKPIGEINNEGLSLFRTFFSLKEFEVKWFNLNDNLSRWRA